MPSLRWDATVRLACRQVRITIASKRLTSEAIWGHMHPHSLTKSRGGTTTVRPFKGRTFEPKSREDWLGNRG